MLGAQVYYIFPFQNGFCIFFCTNRVLKSGESCQKIFIRTLCANKGVIDIIWNYSWVCFTITQQYLIFFKGMALVLLLSAVLINVLHLILHMRFYCNVHLKTCFCSFCGIYKIALHLQVANQETYGTLGAIVQSRTGNRQVGFLTNRHVAVDLDYPNQKMFHPLPPSLGPGVYLGAVERATSFITDELWYGIFAGTNPGNVVLH